MVNAPLLRKVMEHIEAHQDEWNQAMWRTPRGTNAWDNWMDDRQEQGLAEPQCGTAYCLAGWVVELTGGTFAGEEGHSVLLPSGETESTHSYAARELGLEADEALSARLFAATNTLDEVRAEVVQLIGRDA